MATSLTTITNISRQVIPILIDDIDPGDVNANATIAAHQARQLQIPPGSETKIETQRVDVGQLERLRDLRVITFTTA